MFESIIMINGKDDLSRVNYRFQVIAVASANSQFPPGKLALSKFRPHLHTIPAHVSIYHFRQFSATPGRTPTRCVAALRRYLPLTVRRLRVSIENTPSSAPLPAFSSRCVCVCFLNNFHRQHSLNVPPLPTFRPTQPTAQSTPTPSRIELLFPSFPKS